MTNLEIKKKLSEKLNISENNIYISGSKYFFENIKTRYKDVDVVIYDSNYLTKNQNINLTSVMIQSTMCDIFYLKPIESIEKFIEDIKSGERTYYEIIETLIPKIVSKYKITINDLKILKPYFKLNDQHHYYNIIMDFYIQNNDFYLTEEQTQIAYEDYLKNRKHKTYNIKMLNRKFL